MKRKANEKSKYMDVLSTFSQMIGDGNLYNMISEIIKEEPQEKYPYYRLGNGFELRPIELIAKDGKTVIKNRESFCNLYHNDIKVSNDVFRKGGGSGTFKHGYCSLIHYTKERDHEVKNHGFSLGTSVIINESGKVCLAANGYLDYPYHIGGHIGSLGQYIYDLRTGVAIAPKPKSSTMITGLNCVIIEHIHSWYADKVKLPVGIYRLDFNTTEITLIDQIK